MTRHDMDEYPTQHIIDTILPCRGKFHPKMLTGSPERWRQRRENQWENQPFSSFKSQYLKNGSRYGQSYY